MFQLHHVALTVPDLDAAVAWYTAVFGLEVSRREAETDANPLALGLRSDCVRLKGVHLGVPGDSPPFLELHEFLTPTGEATRRLCDTGISHFAFSVSDIQVAYDHLKSRGVAFCSVPQYIAAGGLAGDWWVHFIDPWGNRLELTSHPEPASPDSPGSGVR